VRGPAAIILNPRSGGADARHVLAPLLRESGVDATIRIVPKGADVTELAKQLFREGYRSLVAAGGDGTVRSVAAAVVHTEAALGILPLGTLNHFAKDLKLPTDLAGAVRVLSTGIMRAVDVGGVNGHIFVNSSGLGLYPLLVTEREKLRRMGESKWVAFLRAAVAIFRRFPFVHVRLALDGQLLNRRTPFVFVGNNRYRMEGISIGSRDSLNEGVLFVVVAHHRIGRWGLIRLPFRALFGHIRKQRDFAVFITKEVRITSRRRRLLVSLDGEVMPLATPLDYRTQPGALRVIAPEAG